MPETKMLRGNGRSLGSLRLTYETDTGTLGLRNVRFQEKRAAGWADIEIDNSVTGASTFGGSSVDAVTGNAIQAIEHSAFVPANYRLLWSDEFNNLSLEGTTINPRWMAHFDIWDTWYLEGNADKAWKEYEDTTRDGAMSIHDALHARAVAGDYPVQTRYLHDVSGGTLKLRGYPMPAAIKGGVDVPFYGFDYVAGMISGNLLPVRKYAYFEVRLRVNSITNGQHFALWLLPTHGIHPPEIDMAEFVIGTIEGAITMEGKVAVGYHHVPASEAYVDQEFVSLPDYVDGASDFHTFGCLIDPEQITNRIDGNISHTRENTTPLNPLWYLLASWEVGSNWPGPVDGATVWPCEVEIDYARLYEPA